MPAWKSIRRGGRYWRVVAPDWDDPADTSYSRARGGRWNAPGSFGVLYLNATFEVAAANARAYFRPDGIAWDDLLPEALPDVVAFRVADGAVVDAVTAAGVRALKLPADYPFGVGHAPCRRIGRAVFAAGERGIACRSAAECRGPGEYIGEELAIFDRGDKLPKPGRRLRFAAWYPKGATTASLLTKRNR